MSDDWENQAEIKQTKLSIAIEQEIRGLLKDQKDIRLSRDSTNRVYVRTNKGHFKIYVPGVKDYDEVVPIYPDSVSVSYRAKNDCRTLTILEVASNGTITVWDGVVGLSDSPLGSIQTAIWRAMHSPAINFITDLAAE